MLKRCFHFALAIFVLIGCLDSKVQKKYYVPVDEFPKFEEITRKEVQFTPWNFTNTVDSTKARLIHSLSNTSFHFYNAAAFETNQRGLLVGGTGLRIKSTINGGNTWQQVRLSRFADAFHSAAFSNGEAYVVGEGSFIVKSDSTLNNWRVLDVKPSDSLKIDPYTLYKIKFKKQIGFAMGADERIGVPARPLILKTVDAGKTWSVLPHSGLEDELGAINDFDIVSKSVVYMVTQMGNAYKSVDSGMSWKKVFSPIKKNASLNSIDFRNTNTGCIGGLGGMFLFTKDGGKNWKQNKAFQDSTHLNIADIEYLSNELVAITTAQSFVDEERPSFSYVVDEKGRTKVKPLLTKNDSTIFFEGDSFNLFLLKKKTLFVVDRNNVYRLHTENTSLN